MEVKSLLEKIGNNSKRRLYRIGYDDEINELYNTIDTVTEKLKGRVRNIDTIMYHLKNNDYIFRSNKISNFENELNILHSDDIYDEDEVGVYRLRYNTNSEGISGYGIAITLPYLYIAENPMDKAHCSYVLILSKEGKLIFGNGETLENALDDIFYRVGRKDKVIEHCMFTDISNKFYVNIHNVIKYVIAKLHTFENAIDIIEKHITEWINNGCHYTIKDYNKKYPLKVSSSIPLKIYAANNEVG